MEKAQVNYDLPQIIMGNLDSRLRLQVCDDELIAFTHQQRISLGNQTIGVKCQSAEPVVDNNRLASLKALIDDGFYSVD
jgi:hypothetical protein